MTTLIARVRRAELLGVPYIVYVAVMLFVPMGVLALYSFWEAGFLTVEQNFTLSTYRELFAQGAFWKVLVRSLAVGLAAASLITILAFTLSHGLVFRFGRWKSVLFGVVIAASLASFMGRVLAAETLLGEGGVINHSILSLGLATEPVGLFDFGYGSIVVTLTYVWLPVGTLILFGAVQDVNATTIEASHDLGGGRWNTLWRVTVPQAASGLKATFALMFIIATADYVTPSIVGGSKGALVASGVSNAFLGEGNLPLGSAMAFVMIAAMALTLLVAAGVAKIVRQAIGPIGSVFRHRSGYGRTTRKPVFRWSLSFVATFPILAFLLIPVVTIVVFSFNTRPVVGLPITGLTTSWYSSVVNAPGFSDALTTSLTVMVFDVIGSMAIGTMLAFALARRASRGILNRLLAVSVAAPIVIPPVVIGVGYYAITVLFQFPLGIVTTVVAQVLLSAPFVGVVLALRLARIDPHLGEAARDLGARPLRQIWTVTLPLILPSMVGVAFLVAAYSLDELLVTSFTIGARSTLPVWMLSNARTGLTPDLNALAVMLLLGTVGLFGLAALTTMASRIRTTRSLAVEPVTS